MTEKLSRIERLLILHRPDSAGRWCNECGIHWPCKTATILYMED